MLANMPQLCRAICASYAVALMAVAVLIVLIGSTRLHWYLVQEAFESKPRRANGQE
jgi:hypothetical protein